ncbi:MAG TPA: cell division protein ZapA [Cyclobacteriaceae bacterium]|nr:cell division protein ZapA [Cyclobacteriaceae bacterium]
MEELSIRLKIADREYPMKVKREDEEKIRRAGKLINERIRNYKEQYGIGDKQDLLAMVAFDCVVDILAYSNEQSETEKSIAEKIGYLNQLVSQSI